MKLNIACKRPSQWMLTSKSESNMIQLVALLLFLELNTYFYRTQVLSTGSLLALSQYRATLSGLSPAETAQGSSFYTFKTPLFLDIKNKNHYLMNHLLCSSRAFIVSLGQEPVQDGNLAEKR